ncbi:MAG: nicotianamine synthase family protein [Pseudonocardiaceae bacterium]
MRLPDRYRELILSDLDPGEMYLQLVREVQADRIALDYGLTETIIYACEVRYALDVIRTGPPPQWSNFADPQGNFENLLWPLLDPLQPVRLAFAGSGPYPITAALVAGRYPSAQITCIDNNIVAHLLSQAMLERAGVLARALFLDAFEVDYQPFNAVIVAAMVTGKRKLVEKILDSSQALVIVRSHIALEHPRVISLPSPFDEDGILNGTLP